MNNPFANFNPTVILNQIANNPKMMENEMVRNVMQMRQANNTDGLNQMAENIFSQNGRSFTEFRQDVMQRMHLK